MKRGSLVVVGVGINAPGQTTLEAVECMREAERLYYLGVTPLTEHWLRTLNPTATSLSAFYAIGKCRATTYDEIADALIEAVTDGAHVCAAFYGHPGVLVAAAHRAVTVLKRRRYRARMLPGVSADACLVADVPLNPGDFGLQSYEATDFLLRRRRIDPTSNLILWQAGHVAEAVSRSPSDPTSVHVRDLTTRLLRDYPASHPVVLYRAATFPGSRPYVRRIRLARLPSARLGSETTLLLPARRQRRPDATVLRWILQDDATSDSTAAGRRARQSGRAGSGGTSRGPRAY